MHIPFKVFPWNILISYNIYHKDIDFNSTWVVYIFWLLSITCLIGIFLICLPSSSPVWLYIHSSMYYFIFPWILLIFFLFLLLPSSLSPLSIIICSRFLLLKIIVAYTKKLYFVAQWMNFSRNSTQILLIARD